MLSLKELKNYYNNKKVLITGHTGFKGAYMCVLLKYLGAKVYGYSLKPEKGSLYELMCKDAKKSFALKSLNNKKVVEGEVFADVRDFAKLKAFVKKVEPDYILHMAAQPLVLLGYDEPRYTYDVNVMGTVNLFEAIRGTFANKKKLISILNVTTDKVYENNDLSNYAFKENDKLCGKDPYANSKSCSELVTYSYEKSFFYDKKYFRVSTARAGNVIGGGDFNKDRIIPDCYRAIKNKKDMLVRNPVSIRPYQYVLEPLLLYLNIMACQLKDKKYEGHYNIGPDKADCLTTKKLVEKFFEAYELEQKLDNIYFESVKNGEELTHEEIIKRLKQNDKTKMHQTKVIYGKVKATSKKEATFLRLDNSLAKKVFGYKKIYDIDETMRFTAFGYFDILGAGKSEMCYKNVYDNVYGKVEETFEHNYK